MSVLSDPLDNMLFDQVSGFLYILRVILIVWQAELKMMSATLEDSHCDIGVPWDLMKETAGTPGV